MFAINTKENNPLVPRETSDFNIIDNDQFLLLRALEARNEADAVADAQQRQYEERHAAWRAAKNEATARGRKFLEPEVEPPADYDADAPVDTKLTVTSKVFAVPQMLFDRLQIEELRSHWSLRIPPERRNGPGYALRVNVHAEIPPVVVQASENGNMSEVLEEWMELLGYAPVGTNTEEELAAGTRLVHVVVFDEYDFHFVVEEQVSAAVDKQRPVLVSDKPGLSPVRLWRSVESCIAALKRTYAVETSATALFTFKERTE